MGYRNKTIGATKEGLACAACNAAAEKSLLTCPKMAQNAKKTREKRSRNARETLEVSTSAPSQYIQPTLMVV
jgi:hypothetical protein